MTVPDWMLERYHLGELTDAEKRGIEAQLDEADHARLAELATDDAAILHRYPPRVVAIDVQRRLTRGRRRAWAPVLGGGLVLAGIAAATLLVVNLPPTDDGGPHFGIETGDGHRLKGPAALLVHRQTPTGDEALESGALAATGDVLQVKIAPGGRSYAVVVSIDGNGALTRHLPLSGDQAVELEPGKTVALPNAYTLDDAPSFERFFLVAADAPFGVQPVLDAARAATAAADPATTPLPLPSDLTVRDLLVRKESR